jgi:hypothetical protein
MKKSEVSSVSNTTLSQDDRAAMFFDRFVAAFATFDPAAIADPFATPGVTLRADGSLVALTTREEVISYYRNAKETITATVAVHAGGRICG